MHLSATAKQPARRWKVAFVMLAVIAAFYLLREHWGHALGVAPYLLLLACPLMHLFHGRHTGLSGSQAHDDSHAAAQADATTTRP